MTTLAEKLAQPIDVSKAFVSLLALTCLQVCLHAFATLLRSALLLFVYPSNPISWTFVVIDAVVMLIVSVDLIAKQLYYKGFLADSQHSVSLMWINTCWFAVVIAYLLYQIV